MSRYSDSYDSVIRGVSEQVPHDRLTGQHWEQDNLISDPVRGLARRHGSVNRDYIVLPQPLTPACLQDARSRLEQTIFVEDEEYCFHYRGESTPEIEGSTLHPIVLVNKDTHKFFPVASTPETREALNEGISSITAAGRFVLMSSATRKVEYTLTDNMAASAHQHVVWVRGGANSRTFTVYANISGVDKKYEYTTMSSYYEGALDTSGVPATDPEYGKKVNDIVNAYNTAVNQHISAVAKDIAPSNIASKLAALMVVDMPSARADGPYILCEHPDTVITADDGGNGEMMRAVSRDVTAAELVSPRHFPGKIVKVVPKAANSLAYYLKAESTSNSTAFGEVIWRETAGLGVTMDWVFFIGVFHLDQLYVGRSPAELAAITGLTVPEIEKSSCGDRDSSPIPEFFDKTITYMRMFQDRLMIISGSTVFLSKSGDYFNFFRKSVLTLAPDDPIEVFAQGTEDDVITSGVQHDRNVILCGRRYQYIVPGREPMTPTNPYVGVQATYEGANLVPHAVAGSLLFFCQRRERRLTLQRMSPGAVADRLDALDISSQLDGYLTGTPRQIVAMTAPGAVFLRTQELDNGFYVYSYMDTEDNAERLFDSWSRWTFDKSLGVLMGISSDDSGLLAVTVRDTTLGPTIMLDRFVRETGISDAPYLDSMRPYATHRHIGEATRVAFDSTSEQFLLGSTLAGAPALVTQFPDDVDSLYVGTLYDSFCTLTSPYIRDREDKIILDARLTVSKLAVSISNSAAMLAELSYDMGKSWRTAKSWVYREAGNWILNTQGIAEEATITVPVMKENKKYRARLRSRSWLPMTLAVIEWSGQAFTNRR